MKSRNRKGGRAGISARPADGRPNEVASAALEVPEAGDSAHAGAAHAGAAQEAVGGAGPDIFDRWFVPIALGILLLAAALRLPELALNPFHNDEGVNGFFTTNLVRNGTYTYDPTNYHGPSLYYFALVSEILFGLTTEAMRLVPVVFGLLMVGLVFPLRPYLGSLAVLVAGGLLAISPGAVYMSRYFIHETLLVAFTLALVVAVRLYLDRRQATYLLAASVSAALLFTTKETAVVTVGVLLIAVAVGHVYMRLRAPAAAGRPASGRAVPRTPRSVWIEGVEYRQAPVGGGAGGRRTAQRSLAIPGEHVAAAAIVFLVIYVLLYSSFFTNFPKGLVDSVAAYVYWFQHGEATQVQPVYRYLQWMIPADLAILGLGLIGGLIAAIRARDRLWVVIGLWAAGITAAYSMIQYKTPWIALNMLLPLALLGGLAVSELWRSRRLRLGVPVVLAAAILGSGYMTMDLNYNRYDDETYGYVFVHSTRDMLRLIDEIEATAERAGTGQETGIVFVTPDYWPLPWYFRDYPKAGFFGSIVETEEAMIVANVNQEAELAPSIEGRYDRVDAFNLRPGVDLALYVRNDIPKE